MIQRMFEDMPIASSIITIVILGLVFIFIDVIASKSELFHGSVIDKHHKSERNSIETGYVMASNGNSTVIVTPNHEDEKFLIMVKTESGKVVTVECKPEIYYKKEIGQKIDCNAYKGYFTGWAWSLHGIR